MTPVNLIASEDVPALLDRLSAAEPVQSNCMFQLALIVARIAAEPCSEAYKEEAAQALMGLVRAKPKSNVVRLFAKVPQPSRSESLQRVTA